MKLEYAACRFVRFYPDFATPAFNNALAELQADTKAATRFRPTRLDVTSDIEDKGHLGFIDSRALIRNAHFDQIAYRPSPDNTGRSPAACPEAVGEEIVKNDVALNIQHFSIAGQNLKAKLDLLLSKPIDPAGVRLLCDARKVG